MAELHIGDEAADAARAASFMSVVDEFRRVVSHWRYPESARRVHNGDTQGAYRRIRESVRDNVLSLLRMTRELVAARRWEDARAMIERADERWTRWIAQTDAMTRYEPEFDQTTADRVSQSFSEFGNDLMQVPGNALRAAAGSDLGMAAMVLGGLYLLSRQRS